MNETQRQIDKVIQQNNETIEKLFDTKLKNVNDKVDIQTKMLEDIKNDIKDSRIEQDKRINENCISISNVKNDVTTVKGRGYTYTLVIAFLSSTLTGVTVFLISKII